MNAETLANLPPQAVERVLGQVLAGKLDVAGLNVVTENDQVGSMWATPEADYFVFSPTEWNQ